MLKYQSIIDSLTEEQKLTLVTDIKTLGELSEAVSEIPSLTTASLSEVNEARSESGFPSLSGMAASWNYPLLKKVAACLARGATGKGISLIETPSAQVRSSAYALGMSEDPFLSGMTAAAYASGIEEGGSAACIADCSVRNIDGDYLDIKPDAAAINDYLVSPFTTALRHSAPTAVKSTLAVLKNDWHKVNTSTVEKTVREAFPQNVRILYADAPQDTLLTSLLSPNVLFASTPITAVRAALKNYRRIKEDVSRGAVSVDELNTAFADGTAVSEEMLDAAADKVLDFAAMCISRKDRAGETPSSEVEKALAVKAYRESSVLLKNENALPLKKGKVAFIGEAAKSFPKLFELAESALAPSKIKLIGYEDGYRVDEERSDDLIPSACSLAAKADTVVVFLGMGKSREAALYDTRSLSLPAGQDALVSAIAEMKKTIVAVIVGDTLPDMDFDVNCEGVLFVPHCAAECASKGILDMLTGLSPSGKLPFTAYDDIDAYYSTLKKYRDNGYNRIGSFVGYRNYLTEGTEPKYPFGYGLSYTSFAYSKLSVGADRVVFTVKNTGKYAGSEIAQLYIEKVGSAVVRPTRELKGFVKVELQKGKKALVTIPFSKADFAVYDKADGKMKVESGVYNVCIGTSCDDILLRGTLSVEGGKLTPLGETLSDYMQTRSNIVEGEHFLPPSKKRRASDKPKVAPDFPYEKLFLDAFESDEEDEDGAPVSADDEQDLSKFLSDKVTVKTLAEDLSRFAEVNGLALDIKHSRFLISGMAASRLLLVSCDSKELFTDYVSVLGRFFAAPCTLASASEYNSSDDMLGSETSSTPVGGAIAQAAAERGKVQIIGLDDVVPQNLNNWFTPLMRYVSNPETDRITYGNYTSKERSMRITPNVWFVMRIAAKGATVPTHIADISALLAPDLKRIAPSGAAAPKFTANYHQLSYVFDKSLGKNELDENSWKRVDEFLSYVNKVLARAAARGAQDEDGDAQSTAFRIGNKMWLQMERFVAVCLAGGGTAAQALDGVLSAKLLPALLGLLLEKFGNNLGDFGAVLEKYFGEDNIEASKTVLRRIGSV